jgi:large subunit ribosomal protein L29
MAKKAKEIKDLTAEELSTTLRELKQEALNLRLQRATGQLENPARIKVVRRQTARILTAQTAKQSA